MATAGSDVFFLFHRPRLWNPTTRRMDGLGAKAGEAWPVQPVPAGRGSDAFPTIVGDTAALRIRPLRNHARLRHGTAAGCSAAARWDDCASAEPRALRSDGSGESSEATESSSRGWEFRSQRTSSLFAAIHSGHPGVDPYTTAVSDVYQDLFCEGSFTGKGIYDVDAFEEATHGRFPENTLLSHDLIEGSIFARRTGDRHRSLRRLSGALSHLHAAEASVDSRRLAASSMARERVPGPDGPEPNRLSAISRWKIFDNLRSSLVEISQLSCSSSAGFFFRDSWSWTGVGTARDRIPVAVLAR